MSSGPDHTAIINPYEYNRPVERREEFSGRHKILENVQYALGLTQADRPQYRNLAITGPRGIGKTSLVNMLMQMATEVHGLMAVKTVLNNDNVADHATLFEAILQTIIEAESGDQPTFVQKLFQAWRSTSFEVEVKVAMATLKTARKEGAQFPQKTIRDGLQQLYNRASREGVSAILICLDEADLLAKNETAVQSLRSIFEELRGYMLVLSGTDALLERLGATFGPIQRFFDHIALGPFETAEEILSALQLPLPKFDQDVVDLAFASEVHKLTGGHPFQVKLMAFHAYKMMKQRGWHRMRLSVDIADAVLEAAQTTGFADLSQRLDERKKDPFEADIQVQDVYLDEDEDRYSGEENGMQVVSLVDNLMSDAVARGASEMEIVPLGAGTSVRLRVDGVIQPLAQLPRSAHKTVLSRLKIMGGLDIAERRLPQDGRFSIIVRGRRIAGTMTTVPAVRGESAFIRFPERAIHGVDTIGISEHAQQQLEKAIAGNGVILLAGPPDSGKKTLAYALLQKRCGPHSSVAAIERTPSPEADAVVQYRTKDAIGLDVNALVRAVLRTSSDVLYVEDPADADTLERLCQAAIGPRLVIASFGEATDAIDALVVASATIRPALAARAITTSVGVRLLRMLCNDCKTPDPSDRTGLAAAQAGTIYRAAGCTACNDTGYRGRTAIVQVVPVNEKMRSAIASSSIRSAAAEEGMPTIQQVAMEKVTAGITSIDEVLRATPA